MFIFMFIIIFFIIIELFLLLQLYYSFFEIKKDIDTLYDEIFKITKDVFVLNLKKECN